MTDDSELLRQYAEQRSEAAFCEFVGRHFNIVYHAALRRTGGRADLAQEAAQYVFTAVAKQAGALRGHRGIVGWLYTTTRNIVDNLLRAERRRTRREKEATILMSDPPSAEAALDLNRVRHELDGLMDQLPARDREAILLRFFHRRAFAQIGQAFGLSEDAARKRVDRALERLRESFARRGIKSTSAALAAILAGEAALAAPTGLASAVAGAAITQAAISISPGIGLLQLMSLKTTLGTAAALGLAGVLALISLGVATHATLDARAANAELVTANREYNRRVALLAELERDVFSAERRLAETQNQAKASAQSSSANEGAVSSAQQAAERRANGKKFLDTVPQARALVLANIDGWIQNYCPRFYETAQLTPAQIVEFENMATAIRLEGIEIWSEGSSWRWNLTGRNIPVDLVRERFGNDIAQRFEENRRMYGANVIASGVAEYAASAGVPLTDTQLNQIARVVAENNADYRAGGTLGRAGLESPAQDWDGVVAAAQRILSPKQWRATEREFVYFQFRQAIKQASQSMASTAAGKLKP